MNQVNNEPALKKDPFLTGSIVLFKNKHKDVLEAVNSFLNSPLSKKLYLIDNSPSDILKEHFRHPDIIYKFLGKNLGFGKGHNFILKKDNGYHLVLNPDVKFEPEVIPNLIARLENDDNLSLVAPRVLYPDRSHQFTCRRFPSIFDLLVRRSGFLKKFFKSRIYRGEYRERDLLNSFDPDAVIGCFQLFKRRDFIELKGYDPRYFMYMEDIDICRKIALSKKKISYFPDQIIVHQYQRGSAKNINLLIQHILSVFQYFYKWGVINRTRPTNHD